MACNSSPVLRSIADKTFSGVKLCEIDNVRNYKRSRFDEVECYKQVGHVGSGGYGNCLLLQKKSNMTLRVCKIQKRSKSISEPLEIEILRDILDDHPRIIRLHEAIMHTNTMQLYFDYCPGGDLFKLIVHYYNEWQSMPESFIWHAFLQISEGLAYIHHGYDRRQVCGPPPASEWQSIIHGDLKPENIFLGPPTPDTYGYPSLILGDFGLATIDERPVAGTWKWQPPEMPMTSMKADVWAVGAVIHALAHNGRAPLRPRPDGMNPHDFYRWPGARAPISLLGIYSDELHNVVIHGTLEFDPYARYSSLEMLQCVVDEVELGVASDMDWEPLLGSEFSAKRYDENGVTENTTVNSDEFSAKRFDENGVTENTTVNSDEFSAKRYDENGVTENTTVNFDDGLQSVDPMNLQEVDPTGYCDAMEYTYCY